MPKLREKEKVKIFLDSSVVIAAALSFSGGSFSIIRNSLFKNYELLISIYVLEECLRILRVKYPERLHILTMLISTFNFNIVKDPPEEKIKELVKVINFKDAPILASAIESRAKYLITLDKKDFLNPKVQEFAQKYKILILTPKEFISKSDF